MGRLTKCLLLLSLMLFTGYKAHANPEDAEIVFTEEQLQTLGCIDNYYNYGSVCVGDSQMAEFWITNEYNWTIQVTKVSVPGYDFFKESHCPPFLAPGESCYVKVEFHPRLMKSYAGTLTIVTTEDIYRWNLHGRGVE
ncbi:Ig-like domain-containing protein [Bdellovibrio svalbardensis]|uniref:HYDIN/VesB/CFA65-like Ig-like domain-containing protein n=1 Tax=Bdellovibrio svalbardensis TaxID=2972972 RepID=A0ABT6DM61_9BACT|nr:hypothetical protein [Bdellovibrio svalbardensis]MDG0817689.1 hypothetical protein [Bdellovibrio svalbardensis]